MPPLSSLERARAALEAGGRFPGGALNPEIARSWERCVAGGLDPGQRPSEVVVAFPEVKARREARALLRRLALAQMQLLYEQIAGSEFMIAFGDADGVVLDTLSDPRFSESEAGRAIVPGSRWDETLRGTNALGLALVEQAPAAVYGREHFFASHGRLSCVAVPIFDPAGRLAGLIDASSTNEARQQHTHALVRMAAAAVENGLIAQERSDVLLIALHPRAEYLDTLSAGLIALSPEGVLLALNRPARAMLAGLEAEPGQRFEALFDGRLGAVADEMATHGVARLRDRAGSLLHVSCRRLAGRPAVPAKAGPPAARPAVVPAPAAAPSPSFICEDPVLRRRMRGLDAAVRSRLAVHIHGETGTGKELMARHVHEISGRAGPFVAVNCGALPESLFIGELFGHERGAYTSARVEGSSGLIRLADKGTLFLDEVGEIPLVAQSALLRFLDTMELRAIGGTRSVKLDVQIVSATNRDLATAAAARQFRSDLYYRLCGFPIEIPPLRARRDFDAIARHLLALHAPDATLPDAALQRARLRPWHGNIRELQSFLRRAVLVDDLDGEAEEDEPPAPDTGSETCRHCADTMLARLRCRQIREAYRDTGGNVLATARQLGISRTTVYKHLDDA
ncbi:sigma-54-dependent Fis family transcriptional regulator [Ancylobacter amanitiformis]|uniref:Transcriptional regulator of acetoin/glycerol metabolism n=1 Tax=Ancylobacter amanitiformis TaxID=217069 RepID=A0ABU0LMF9_9HYPH|nr:sigma-54-dependent Fis family transcriptional regulator [Ancylobacter amanitiformis]MDQ0509890.1 transcriptional regulator of acetoin/glycerol metabolism [Ancylobacter amanitiformis]